MMVQGTRNAEGKLIAILKTLNDSNRPMGSNTITRKLKNEGVVLSDRGVRYHLKVADLRGFTKPYGRGGRMITESGRQEIKEALALYQLGLVQDKVKMLAFQTTFDPEKRSGLLPINTSLIEKDKYKRMISAMKVAFDAGLCVSELVAVAPEGERLGSVIIPKGKIGFATVSSVAVNGILLKAGVPTEYKFGGLLELVNSIPKRFIAIIDYAGTSLDPSEEFIRSGMTSVNEASRTGTGKVLGVFRTIPAPARNIAEEKITLLKQAGIGGVYAIGDSSEPLCQIPVELNRVAMVQLNGLNPVAAAGETGIEIESTAGSGLIDYQQLQPVWKLWEEYRRGHRSRCYGE